MLIDVYDDLHIVAVDACFFYDGKKLASLSVPFGINNFIAKFKPGVHAILFILSIH